MRPMKDSGAQWLGSLPLGWDLSRIGSLYTVRNTKVSDYDYPPLSVTNKGIVPQLETAAKTNAHDDRKLVRKGDFAINSRSDRRGSCGISSYDGSVSLINTILAPRGAMNPRYYNWLFHTTQFADEFFKWGHGIVDDLWTTGWQDMKSILVPVPSLDEQQRIADFLDNRCAEIDALTADIQKEIETLQEYRRSLITETVTKGLDPDAEMKDSGVSYIGTIPRSWDVKRLRFLGQCQNGISKGHEFFGDEGDPFVSYSDVYRDEVLPNPSGVITSTISEQYQYSVKVGDIFFTRTSETIDEIGFSSVCLKTIPKATFAGFLIRVRPTTTLIVPRFSRYYFRSDIHRRYFVKEMNLVTRASLGQNLLKNLPVLLPSVSEQEKIADFLDEKCTEIDSIIETKQKQIETLSEYRKSLIYEYVTGKKEVV